MARAHPKETTGEHHQTGTELEPSGEEEQRPAKKHLATGPPSRHEEVGIHLGATGSESKGPCTLEIPCRRPIPQQGCQA